MNPHLASADQAKSPSLWLLMMECRAPWEFGASLAAGPILQKSPRGDGHPVIVFPGLGASDLSTVPLRNFLQGRNYVPYGWDLGMNLGPRSGVVAASLARIRNVAGEHGCKVSLVGWSLGGVYAREMAKMAPDLVRGVVTLGTPLHGQSQGEQCMALLRDDQRRQGRRPQASRGSRADTARPHDFGLQPQRRNRRMEVQPREGRACVRRSVEVRASHVGLGLNPAAWYVLADRLSQEEGAWRPFHRDGWRALVYPDPDRPE